MSAELSVSSILPAGKPLQIGLWSAQVLMFAAFVLIGCMKLFMPVQQLAAMWGWPGALPSWFLRLMGGIDVAGGIGILLPALTRIKPGVGVLAALGCVVLQISAIIFHVVRGEIGGLPLNFILLAFMSFILWGRGKRARIVPR